MAAGVARGGSCGAFWCDLPYGTERQFNPVSVIANEGLDIVQLEGHDNRLDSIATKSGLRRLGRSIAHPVQAVDRAGWGNFVGSEIVPTSFRPSKAAWIPNWQLHTVGGGFTNARLEDWYRAHGCDSPFWPALLSSYAANLANEAAEVGGSQGSMPTDPVADLYLFDALGVALFHVPVVRSFALREVELVSWPLQPSLGLDRWTAENAGQYYALRVRMPGTTDWKLLYHFGLGNIGGVSRRVGSEDAVSLGVGAYARRIQALDATTNHVEMAPKVGVFWDRNGSLLGSAFWNAQSVDRFSVQVYPGAVPTGPLPLGCWMSFDEHGHPSAGVSTVVGLGAGSSRRP